MIKFEHLPDLVTLQSIFEGLQDAIYCHDLDRRLTHWSPSAERMFGYTAGEILGRSVDILIPENKQQEKKELMRMISTGTRIDQLKTSRLHRSGKQIPVSLTVSPIKNTDGEIIGSSQIAHDITGEEVAEEKQAILAAIIESSEDAIISKTLEGIITTWNKGAEYIFGYTEQEAVGRHISLLLPEDRLAEEDVIIASLRRGEKIDHFQTVRKTKDGQFLDISLTVSPIKNSRGIVIGASKVARNITTQKASELQITRHMEQLELLNRIGKSINESTDIQQILQKVTDATTQLTGADFGAFFYNRINDDGESYWLFTISGAPREAFEHFPMPRNTAVFHPTFSGEGIVRSDDITKDPRYGKNSPYFGKPDGHLPVVSYLAVPVISSSGSVIGGLFFGHKEKGVFKAEHEGLVVTVASQAAVAIANSKLLTEVQDLSAKKDQFIALASHELKTPLTSLSGFLQLVQRSVPEGVARGFTQKAIKQLDKMRVLVNDLFDISKIQSGKLQLDLERFKMADFIREVKDTFRQTHPDHTVDMQLEEDTWVSADRIRLEQVLTNLMNNAVKYAPASNRIEVRSARTENKICTWITDFGPGILKENQEHIFSQFYRIKDQEAMASGLGLGLFISKDIIERHGGHIWVESEPGQGASFIFSLPAHQN